MHVILSFYFRNFGLWWRFYFTKRLQFPQVAAGVLLHALAPAGAKKELQNIVKYGNHSRLSKLVIENEFDCFSKVDCQNRS